MPTYDYVCSACGYELEVVHGVHGHGPSACPRCGGPMRKSFSAPAIHFKGSGWAKKERGGGAHGPSAAPRASTKGEPAGAGSGGESGADPGSGPEAARSSEAGTARPARSGAAAGDAGAAGGSAKD